MKKLSLVIIALFLAAPLLIAANIIQPIEFAKATYTPTLASTPIRKVLFAYGDNFDAVEDYTYASTFDVIVTDRANAYTTWSEERVEAIGHIKALNPAIKIYFYWNFQGVHPTDSLYLSVLNLGGSVFYRDAGGNYVSETAYGYVLTNPGNTAYVALLKLLIQSQIANGFDGVFFDVVEDHQGDNYTFNATVTDPDPDLYHAWTVSLLTDLTSYVHALHTRYNSAGAPTSDSGVDAQILVNSNEGWQFGHDDTTNYIDIVDGQEVENFLHGIDEAAGAFGTTTFAQGTFIANETGRGKIILVESGCLTNAAAVVEYCYAGFLIAQNGTYAYWGWNTGENYMMAYNTTQPQMNYNIGSRSSFAAYTTNSSLYLKLYSGGLAAINLDSSGHSVTPDPFTYVYYDTAMLVTTLTLAAKTGEVLQAMAGTYTITSSVPAGGGTITKAPDYATYTYDQEVTITAVPANEYIFDHWDIVGSSSGASYTNPFHTWVKGNFDIQATFYYTGVSTNPHSITYGTHSSSYISPYAPMGNFYIEPHGTVNVTAPPLITESWSTPTFVTMKAVPVSGYHFKNWQIDGVNSTAGSWNAGAWVYGININGAHTVYAFFESNTVEPSPSATPYPTPSGLTPGDTTAIFSGIVNYIVAAILILAPAFVLGVVFHFGGWGFIAGIGIGSAIGHVVMPATVPLWVVFVALIGIVGMLWKGNTNGV